MKLFAYQTIRQSVILILLSAVIGISVNSLRSDRVPLIGEWSPEAQMVSADGKKMAISLEEAKTLFNTQKAVFLDARSPEDYQGGHIQGAKNLPWLEFAKYFDQTTSDIAQDQIMIAYCDGETCHLSKELAKALTEMGFQNARVLINGWSLWIQNGLPIQKGLR
ncbi:MAG: hypothetical protein BWK80_57270 [Desulfobacteraceae bacterium IS3]|nr:MAG: hypothetical protein BWK80_57270 [Desulfobacteraceae bacterium IS3]HAO21773.1 rhodanese [Desulfobacteraceae bacterium]